MALSQAQWYEKLKSWVPTWFWQQKAYQEAHFQALAKILSTMQAAAEESTTQTFIASASGSHLDLHGDERTTPRLSGEIDSTYSTRIRSLANLSNKVSIKQLVDELLIIGECVIGEDFNSFLFFNRDAYMNRGLLILESILNTFTIVFENQTRSPESFLDREYFMDRGDVFGTLEASDEFFRSIIAAVDRAKAFGTFYRVIERVG